MIKAIISSGRIYSTSPDAFTLQNKSNFGERSSQRIEYSPVESLFLVETKKLEVYASTKLLTKESLLKKLKSLDKRLELKYLVFKDLRQKGYILKSALKFGADFRIYNKGEKPGKAHAKWLLFAIDEHKKIDAKDFSAKNRIAHSTKKNLLLAIIDDESSITYYEIHWKKP